MAYTKQQRLSFAVLALAVAAWCTDRFILHGGATEPSAAQASLLITHTSSPQPLAPNKASVSEASRDLTQRLDRFSATLQNPTLPAPNVFSPPQSWLPEQTTITPMTSSRNFSSNEFRQSHTLTAIVRAGPNSQVFMGATIIRLGERIDGFTLLSVNESAAVFVSEGMEVTLDLENPHDNPSPATSSTYKLDKTPLKHATQ